MIIIHIYLTACSFLMPIYCIPADCTPNPTSIIGIPTIPNTYSTPCSFKASERIVAPSFITSSSISARMMWPYLPVTTWSWTTPPSFKNTNYPHTMHISISWFADYNNFCLYYYESKSICSVVQLPAFLISSSYVLGYTLNVDCILACCKEILQAFLCQRNRGTAEWNLIQGRGSTVQPTIFGYKLLCQNNSRPLFFFTSDLRPANVGIFANPVIIFLSINTY